MSPFETLAGMIADLRVRLAAQPTYRWGIVTDLNPVRVQHDGINEMPQIVESSLARLRAGDRVRVQHLGTSRLVVGIRNPTGLPVAMAADPVTVTGTGAATATASVTFPAGRFTVPPLVVDGDTQNAYKASYQDVTETGMTVSVRRLDNATFSGAITVRWLAIQMTPTSAGG